MEVTGEVRGARGWSASLRFSQQSVSLIMATNFEIMSSSRLKGEAPPNMNLVVHTRLIILT